MFFSGNITDKGFVANTDNTDDTFKQNEYGSNAMIFKESAKFKFELVKALLGQKIFEEVITLQSWLIGAPSHYEKALASSIVSKIELT